MVNTTIQYYYCCLNPAERTALQIAAANAGPITYFVLKTLIDAAFLLAVEGSSTNRKAVFIANNYMTYGRLPPEDPDGIEVYYLDPTYWNSVNAFLDEHGTGCPEPCKILTFTS